jgi:hypothetical protein
MHLWLLVSRLAGGRSQEMRLTRSRKLQLVKLEFQRYVLGTIRTVVVRKAATGDFHVLAEIDGPCVEGVPGEKAVLANFEAVGPAGEVLVWAPVVSMRDPGAYM